ncbi:hypothetical protein SDC9_114508 [bioreactor metagenome]|uniref:Uncharacterized protein n=1 Tax=bioreactor metagenome TaxID=1076179 RepID=A0A645BQL1_9ZZZZ
MAAKDGGRALFRDVSGNGGKHGVCFCFGGNHAEKVLAGEKRRNGERESMGRNIGKRLKAAVVDLLLTAYKVKLYDLDGLRIVEKRYMRIVEGDMSVFAYSHADDIYRMIGEQL